jgi:protein-tyrosine phosphatase
VTSTRSNSARRTMPANETPSEIAPGVYVGNWKDALEFEGARFCVLDEAPADMPPATHIPIYSEAAGRADRRKLDRLADAMKAARAKATPVLVFCGHGKYRSPLGGAWYLHRAEGIPLDEAYSRVRAVRPGAHRSLDWIGNLHELRAP